MEKVILITSGSRGIGQAIAFRFAQEGFHIIFTYANNKEAAELTEKKCLDLGAKSVKIIQADGSDLANISKLIDGVKNYKKIDCVVFNTGLTCRKKIDVLTVKDWNDVMNANVNYPIFFLQALLPLLNKNSVTIFTGSMMGVYPHGTSLAYGVSKSAVHSLVKNLVKELEPYQIRVNAIAPGFIDTEWQINKPKEIRDKINSKIALHRFATPEEVASAYYFVYENRYLNGEILELSGGYCYE